MKLKPIRLISSKISKMALKGKKAAPDVAIIGGLALVIAGGVWLGKRSYDASCELKQSKAKIDDIKDAIANADTNEEDIREYKAALMEERKGFATKMIKTVIGPIVMIGSGCYLVIWGRNGYKSTVIELGTLLSAKTTKLNKLSSKIDEEHGEGTAAKWANGLEDKIVEYKDPETKKKEKSAVTVKNGGGIDGFAFVFDDRSRRYSKDPSLNRMMFNAAEKELLKAYDQRFVSGMEWFNECGYRASDVYDIYSTMYGSKKGREMVDTLMHSGWMEGQTCPPTYHYNDVYKSENETFLQGYESQCIIEPVGMIHMSQLA